MAAVWWRTARRKKSWRDPNSLTGAYISGKVQIEMRAERRQKNGAALTILGAKENNLKNLDVTFPLGRDDGDYRSLRVG